LGGNRSSGRHCTNCKIRNAKAIAHKPTGVEGRGEKIWKRQKQQHNSNVHPEKIKIQKSSQTRLKGA